MSIQHQCDLHCKSGGSDKVYHMRQEGCMIYFASGRRGSGLQRTEKEFASSEKAEAAFLKKFKEQIVKDYVLAEGISGNVWGTGMASTTTLPSGETGSKSSRCMDKVPSGFKPQLLNEISEEGAKQYIESDEWGAQEKKNGRRHTFQVQDRPESRIIGSNKHGIIVPTVVFLDKPVRNVTMDGETIGGKLFVFDLLHLNDFSFKDHSYRHRYNELMTFHRLHCNSTAELVPLWVTTAAKQELWDKVKAAGGEGIVFKRLDAPFTEGRPNRLGDQLKVVFWQHTQARVSGITDGKRSVALECYDPKSGNWIPMGNVTIPANYEIPTIGEFVEIRYKYYYEGGSLFQPQYEGTTDVATREDTDFNKLLRFTGEE